MTSKAIDEFLTRMRSSADCATDEGGEVPYYGSQCHPARSPHRRSERACERVQNIMLLELEKSFLLDGEAVHLFQAALLRRCFA